MSIADVLIIVLIAQISLSMALVVLCDVCFWNNQYLALVPASARNV